LTSAATGTDQPLPGRRAVGGGRRRTQGVGKAVGRARGHGNCMSEGVSSSQSKRSRSLPIGAVVAVALAAAFVVWLVVRDDDSSPSTSAVTTPPAVTPPRR